MLIPRLCRAAMISAECQSFCMFFICSPRGDDHDEVSRPATTTGEPFGSPAVTAIEANTSAPVPEYQWLLKRLLNPTITFAMAGKMYHITLL